MIRIEFHTDDAALHQDDSGEGWKNETSQLLHQIAERIFKGEHFPLKLRDTNGNGIGFADYSPVRSNDEIVVTLIAGKLHRWIFFPGEWIPFEPQANQLMRMRR